MFEATLAPTQANANVERAVNFNCAPTDPILVVRRADGPQNDETRELVLMRWGLVPFFVREFRDAKPLINARVETVATSRAFRESFKKRRCLVLADGFYEWTHKVPHVVQRPGGVPFAMAGLWDRWKGTIKGQPERIETCTIITCPPSESVAPLHDRMPLALEKADYSTWLDPTTDEPRLHDVLSRRVSDWIVTPLERMPDSKTKQMKLFA